MSKFIIQSDWDQCPHLSQAARDALWSSIPPYQRNARTKGIPILGSGAIYPMDEELLRVADFPVPDHYIKGYGMDVGWNRTAALWGALDRDTDVLYLYSAHYMGETNPHAHAAAIKARGSWIPGVIDPASRGRSQKDGSQLLQIYKDLGLDIETAINAREAGIYAVWERMMSGRIKVFASVGDWWNEFRLYRRDEKGKVVKDRDHLMDCMRYLVMSGIDRMKPGRAGKAKATVEYTQEPIPAYAANSGWMM